MYYNKEELLFEWITSAIPEDIVLLYDVLVGSGGNMSVSLYNDLIVTSYVNGSKIREYTFVVSAILPVSDMLEDTTNFDNMRVIRACQQWLLEQAEDKNFPFFGDNAKVFKITSTEAPVLEQSYENNLARYGFSATIHYLEVKNERRVIETA